MTKSDQMQIMPLSHARDALADQVRRFCNECVSSGPEGATPDEWVERFRAWQEFDDIGARYARETGEIANGQR
jgi:hypothetical protein